MASIWTGTDVGAGETIDFPGTVSLAVGAPTNDDFTLLRLIWSPSVRAHITSAAGIPENWWVSSEVLMDVVFAQDGVDVFPDVTGGDERLLHVSHLQPKLAYAPTANHYSIIWEPIPTEIQNRTSRRTSVPGSGTPTVYFHFTPIDQHGVFLNGTFATNRLYAVNLSARALWRRNF